MKNNVVSQKTIDAAVQAINEYYDSLNPTGMINKKYLITKGICSESESDKLISCLEGLGLIEYSDNNKMDIMAITRLNRCKCYLEERKEITKSILFTRTISVISLVISLAAFVKSFF